MTAAVTQRMRIALREPPLVIVCPACSQPTSLHTLHSSAVGGAVLRIRRCEHCRSDFTCVDRPLDSDSLPVPPGCPSWALRAAAALLRVATRRT